MAEHPHALRLRQKESEADQAALSAVAELRKQLNRLFDSTLLHPHVRKAMAHARAQLGVLHGVRPMRNPHDENPDPAANGWRKLLRNQRIAPRVLTHLLVLLLALLVVLGEQTQVARYAGLQWQMQASGLAAEQAAIAGELVALPVPPITLAMLRPVVGEEFSVAPHSQLRPEAAPAFLDLHTLAAEESLEQVAARYGISVNALVWANNLTNGDILAIGQSLRIPRISGIPHVLQEGETLEQVAARYGVAPEAIILFAANNLREGESLPVGREIFVPGGTQAYPQSLLDQYGGEQGLATAQAQLAGIILDAETNIRLGPSRVYQKVTQLDAGRRVRLLGQYENWLKIEIAGTVGWIRNDLLQVPAEAVQTLPIDTNFPPPPPVWVWPTYGELSSGFGARWGSFHNGIDIANRPWTPIVAARSGVVIEAGWCSGYGYCVKLDHGDGMVTEYGHMIDTPVVDRGTEVTAGELIGYMGSTYDRSGGGYSTGNHLHFTVLINGRAVNPLKFLP